MYYVGGEKLGSRDYCRSVLRHRIDHCFSTDLATLTGRQYHGSRHHPACQARGARKDVVRVVWCTSSSVGPSSQEGRQRPKLVRPGTDMAKPRRHQGSPSHVVLTHCEPLAYNATDLLCTPTYTTTHCSHDHTAPHWAFFFCFATATGSFFNEVSEKAVWAADAIGRGSASGAAVYGHARRV